MTPRSGEKKVNDANDVFFKSLAEQAAEKAIGIIFGGLGSDGAKGVQFIKEKGGIIMVQSPESANFSSMPLEAIVTDHPDVIAPPDKIAKDLLNFIKHPSIIIGMDLDDVRNDLFKPFKRLTADDKGKGIGLHLVRAMIEKTGGKIEVESEKGRGSRFYVYLKDLR